ncbi:MAG: hypothetical protein IPJ30_12715 [Acidobacteria bacterium]|nr:hypothetical protein [Acidobacteriota bacterium]
MSAGVKAEQTAIARRTRATAQRTDSSGCGDPPSRTNTSEAQNEITRLKDELARDCNRELSEHDVSNVSDQIKDLREENGRLREEIGKLKVENDGYKKRLADAEAEKQLIREQQEKDNRTQQILSDQPLLVESLKRVGRFGRRNAESS